MTNSPESAVPASDTPAHILVVDDNELNRDVLSRRLRRQGYSVEQARDGREAIEMVAEATYDLILLDVMMPGVSGMDVLRDVRKTKSAADLPVIMVTAKDSSRDVVEALNLGANDYVTKPLDFPVLVARAETHLALKRANDKVLHLADDLSTRNEFIRQTFGRYLNDEVVANLLETPGGLKLGGETRDVAILMSDIRGFTAVSERLPPEKVMRLLNGYLAAMTEVIFKYQGTIDEFIGDAILAIFGAPVAHDDDTERAMACALAMQLEMTRVNEQFSREGLPRLEMGIGIHAGEVVVGNIGSEKRAKFGIVGSPVNLAGRVESYSVGGQVLVSGTAASRVFDRVTLGETIEIVPKGAAEPLIVHELHGITGTYTVSLPPESLELVRLPTPVPVRFDLIDENRVGNTNISANLVKLSAKSAELTTDEAPKRFSNMRISLESSGNSPDGRELYGKVTRILSPESVLVRFTSVAPETDTHLQSLLSSAAGS